MRASFYHSSYIKNQPGQRLPAVKLNDFYKSCFPEHQQHHRSMIGKQQQGGKGLKNFVTEYPGLFTWSQDEVPLGEVKVAALLLCVNH